MQLHKSDENLISYEYGVEVNLHNLLNVQNPNGKTRMMLYFNSDEIKNFHLANDIALRKFNQLLSNDVEFCRQQGQAGIKCLSQSAPEVKFTFNGKQITKPFTHEIKISQSPARIGLITLEPITPQDPKLLVACIYMKEGLHDGKGKKYAKQATLIDQLGIFKKSTHAVDAAKSKNDTTKKILLHPKK